MAGTSYYTNQTALGAKFDDLSVDDDVFTAANLYAYNRINAELDRFYAVPFDTYAGSGTPPGIIGDISDAITMWRVKRYTVGHSTMTKGPLKDLYDEAIAMLTRIGKGEVSIPGVTRSDVSALSSSTQNEHPVFASIDELDMVQDPDQSDRLYDERG